MGKRFSTLLFAGSFVVAYLLLLCVTASAFAPNIGVMAKFNLNNTAQKRTYTISTEAGPDGSEGDIFRFKVEKANFSCTEGKCEHYYDSCRLELDYNITSLLSSAPSQETEIRCNAIIKYQTGGGDSLLCESDSEVVVHIFSGKETCHANIHFDFYFSYYEAVEHADLESVECHILDLSG